LRYEAETAGSDRVWTARLQPLNEESAARCVDFYGKAGGIVADINEGVDVPPIVSTDTAADPRCGHTLRTDGCRHEKQEWGRDDSSSQPRGTPAPENGSY
jgi:hypothetical protein